MLSSFADMQGAYQMTIDDARFSIHRTRFRAAIADVFGFPGNALLLIVTWS